MNLPNILGHFYSDCGDLPEIVVLDFKEALYQYNLTLSSLRTCEAPIDGVFADMLCYIDDYHSLELSLLAYEAEVCHIYGSHGKEDEARCIVNAIVTFARAVVAQLIHFGLYTKEGVLPYLFGMRENDSFYLLKDIPSQ